MRPLAKIEKKHSRMTGDTFKPLRDPEQEYARQMCMVADLSPDLQICKDIIFKKFGMLGRENI